MRLVSRVNCSQFGKRVLISALKELFVIQVKCVGRGPLRSAVEQITQVVFSVLSKHLQPPRLFEQAHLICPPTRSDPHAPVKPVQIAQPRHCTLATRLRSLARSNCGSQQNSATSSAAKGQNWSVLSAISSVQRQEVDMSHLSPSSPPRLSRLTQSGCWLCRINKVFNTNV